MKRFRLYIINFVGYTKTEANATILLVSIVVLFAIAPRVYLRKAMTPDSTTQRDQELLSEWLEEIDNSIRRKEAPKKPTHSAPTVEPFAFDPNLASADALKKLGFKPYVASRIVKYRKAGGAFKTPGDLLKIFGVDSSLVEKLQPYVAIEPVVYADDQPNRPVAEQTVLDKPEAEEKKISFDLNLVTDEELQQIRGIGPFYARHILKYRNELGGFYAHDQLAEVYKMKASVVELLKEHTFISTPPQKQLWLNTDSLKHLAHHPYLSWNQARVILNYRKQHGTFQDGQELLEIKIIDDSLYQKISPYISVEP